jgi:hypothetical protein
MAVQGRSHLGNHPVHRKVAPGSPFGDPGDLPVQVRALIGGRHPGVDDGPTRRGVRANRLTDHDQASNLVSGHRELPSSVPAQGRVV